MTRSDLQTLVLSWLDDPQAGYFTLPQVNVWLNNATKECQKRLIKAGQNYYTHCVQTTLVVNQRGYALPIDFKKLNRLEIIMNGTPPNEATTPLIPITINQRDLVYTGSGTPQFYTIERNNLIIRPAPDTALTMRMIYTRATVDMSADTETPDAPQDYHEYIALLAAQDGFLKDGRASELLVKKIAEYERHLDEDAQERNQDSPRSIVVTGNDTSQGFYW